MTLGASLFIGFLIVQRLSELVIAQRNTKALLAEGAVEVSARHYPLIVVVHAAWIAAIVLLGMDESIRPGWLAVFVLLQAFRVWILVTLGRRWTTRIIVTGTPLVAKGPFLWLRHPNYTLVVAEIAVAPMVLGLWQVALVFSILNAGVLALRIPAEDRALRPYRDA
ncbi:isoprenylcysteine carboxyl methyltransferase family protein [Palleronia sp. LCG004]|uniref:isoprenylcysteine carboxyl methyltransferase family protein n=1 Tax=Palleronia sp. LCG004 TaxID=3079304 RepID=UPI0029432AEB|nr:isoprenylcysteine carboxylmethyltransferase family protein [Palleronia sp. LCG004]WOI55720.1 isoprenylcysteine carboxylmethyltransferase family protein [Palleronia sp. LCG004]